jgi:hypothetical protein
MPRDYFFRWLPSESQERCTQPDTDSHFAHFELISSNDGKVETQYLCQHHLNKLAQQDSDVKKVMLQPGSGVRETNPNTLEFKRPR